MRFRYQSSNLFVSFAMTVLQIFAFAVFLSALAGRGAPMMDKKVMEEMQERLKRLRDVPGFDPDEYKRYWDEMLNNDPRKDKNYIHVHTDRNDVKDPHGMAFISVLIAIKLLDHHSEESVVL